MPASYRFRYIASTSRPLLCGLLIATLGIGAPLAFAQDTPDEPAAEEAATTGPSTAEVARRAAIRKNRDERRALREVLFQHTGLCDQKPAQYCPQNNYASCVAQLQQTCTAVKLQREACATQTTAYCNKSSHPDKCLATMQKQCDSSKQSIDQILAKYPDLTPTQKAQLKQIALKLEADQDRSLFDALASRLINLLGFAI